MDVSKRLQEIQEDVRGQQEDMVATKGLIKVWGDYDTRNLPTKAISNARACKDCIHIDICKFKELATILESSVDLSVKTVSKQDENSLFRSEVNCGHKMTGRVNR